MSGGKYSSARIPAARALGAPSVMHGTYTGAELERTSSRPGAYDALTIPSRIGGRLVTPIELHAEVNAPSPAPITTRAPVAAWAPLQEPVDVAPTPAAPCPPPLTQGRISLSTYHGRKGSAPALVIAALEVEGGHLTYSEIATRFNVPRTSVTAIFKSAMVKGALARHLIDGQHALSLPGYVPPPAQPAASIAPATPPASAPPLASFSEIAAAHALLEQRKATLSAWQRHVIALDKRLTLQSIQAYLQRLNPIAHIPAD